MNMHANDGKQCSVGAATSIWLKLKFFWIFFYRVCLYAVRAVVGGAHVCVTRWVGCAMCAIM